MNTVRKNNKNKVKMALYLWLGSFISGVHMPTSLLAQNGPTIRIEESGMDKTFSQRMADCIMPLDKSYVTTGLLADKAYSLVSLASFDGQTDTLVSFKQWKQIHRQLYLAAVSENDTIHSPEYLKQIAHVMKDHGVVPIALMNLKYNRFKPYAIDSNLIVFSNGKLYDVQERTESPYLEERLFAATVYQERIYNGRVTFQFPNELFLTNSSENVSEVIIDFGDGRGYQSYMLNNLLNNNVTINYWQTGTKTITIRMTFSDQTVLQTKTRITLVPRPEIEPDEILNITGLLYNGKRGTGKAYILYGCGNNGQLRKPIIVSDGFDPENNRDFYGLFELLNEEQFVMKAIAEGYDFVILDYTEGADCIQRNAFVMVSLIEEVNNRLNMNGYHPKLTIIGPSMGGLITRYALNYMEQNRLDHNTGLYVSFDSPHLGANIPLGDQHWLNFFASATGNNEAIDNLQQLNTTAAKQMLIYHYSATDNNEAKPHLLRTDLLTDPYYNSWPTQCRKIAIANGSGTGTTLFAPSTQMIDWEWCVLFGSINLIKGNVWALPARNDGEKKIFEGKAPYFEHTGFLGFELGIVFQNVYIDGSLPYDGAPGGTYDVNDQIASANTDDHGDIQTNYPDICFIPLISSLALQNTVNVNFNVHGIPGYPYPSSNITPFDAIYAPANNQDHVTVTNENIGWIMNEIGAFDLYLQNQTVNKATDFEARNSITTGRNVLSYIPVGDFVVQNGSGEVLLHSEGTIQLKEGTHLRPWGEGTVRLYISAFPCSSWSVLPENPTRGNNNSEEIEIEHQAYTEIPESIAPTSSEKLPRSYPNPCSDYTTIEYELEKNAKVEIDVYNLMGVKMFTVEDRQNMGAGRYTTMVNTSSLPTGMYIGIVRANGETNGVLKMQVMK